MEVWQQFKGNDYEGLHEFINSFVDQIYSASHSNYTRWPQYGNGDIEWAKDESVKSLDNRIAWLVSQWGEGVGVEDIETDSDIAITTPADGLITIASLSPISSILVSDISGKVIINERDIGTETQINCPAGIYIVKATTHSSTVAKKVVVK